MSDAPDATIDTCVTAWNALDVDALYGLWDADAAAIHYVAEELEQPLYRLDDVLDYWRRTAEIVTRVSMTTADRRIQPLGSDYCVATYAMHADIDLSSSGAIGVDLRVSAILRRTDNGWRFIHYVEAPLGTLPFLRRVYADNVRNPG